MPRGGKRQGAGRPTDGTAPKTRLAITIDPELVQFIDHQVQSSEQPSNRSQFIEDLVRAKFKEFYEQNISSKS